MIELPITAASFEGDNSAGVPAQIRDGIARYINHGDPVGGFLSGQRWTDGISWDDLQRLKRECGRGESCAVELFPPDSAVVNVANIRHIWIVETPVFLWTDGESECT